MVDPLFRALTRTPSSFPGPAVTVPLSAGPACCAADGPAAVMQAIVARQTRLAITERRDMSVSPTLLLVVAGSVEGSVAENQWSGFDIRFSAMVASALNRRRQN